MSRNKKKRISGFVGFAVCLGSVVCLTACAKEEETKTLLQEELMSSEQANYNTEQAKIGTYEKEASGSATALYLIQDSLSWEKDNAYYRESFVKSGQEVKKGDVLMQFDIKEDRTELETLELQLLRKKEEREEQMEERFVVLETAKRKLEDMRDPAKYVLLEYDLEIQQLRIEKLQAEFEQYMYQSEQEIQQMEERIGEIRKAASENVLTAPFDGVIKEVTRYNVGDKVPVNQTLITMYSTDKLLLKAENASGKLRYNMEVVIEAGNKKNPLIFTGKVVTAPNILPSSVKKDLTLIELNASLTREQVIENEQNGNIRYSAVTERLQDILVIDRKALEKEDNKFYVNILEGDMVQKRYVVSTINNMDVAWILDGLTEGQTVIVD